MKPRLVRKNCVLEFKLSQFSTNVLSGLHRLPENNLLDRGFFWPRWRKMTNTLTLSRVKENGSYRELGLWNACYIEKHLIYLLTAAVSFYM